MRTENQKQSSRTNGAKSKGPITEEGKAKSALNGTRHNLAGGQLILLSTEDPAEYQQLIDDFMHRFQPIDGVERSIVHRLIAANWREQRMDIMERSLGEFEMRSNEKIRTIFNPDDPPADDATRQTMAFLGAANRREATALLIRYQAAARRAFTTAMKILKELQGDRFNRQQASQPISQPAESQPAAQTTAQSETQTPPTPPTTAVRPMRPEPTPISVAPRNPENVKLQPEPDIPAERSNNPERDAA